MLCSEVQEVRPGVGEGLGQAVGSGAGSQEVETRSGDAYDNSSRTGGKAK